MEDADADRVDETRALKPVANDGGTIENKWVWNDRVYAEYMVDPNLSLCQH